MKQALRVVWRAALIVAPLSLGAQAPAQLKLKPADAKLDEEFSGIVSARELPDGRLLVSDAKDNRVVVVDFKMNTVAQVGRNGQGPGEYQSVGFLRAIDGDSTLMVEPRGGRWHLFAGAKIATTLPPDAPIVTAMIRQAAGADAHGHVVRTIGAGALAPPVAGGRGGSAGAGANFTMPESLLVIRGVRASGKLDTLAVVKAPKTIMTTTTDAKGEIKSMNLIRPPLAVGDEVAMFADGWTAIVRVSPYRVDWVSPDAKLATGAVLPWPAVKINDREKMAYFMARARSPQQGGAVPADVQKAFDDAQKYFPDVYPPFAAGGALAMDDGRVLVRHPDMADHPNARYDVIDRRGRVAGTIDMAKGESILAITRKYAYVAWKDADDIERIRRHPWP